MTELPALENEEPGFMLMTGIRIRATGVAVGSLMLLVSLYAGVAELRAGAVDDGSPPAPPAMILPESIFKSFPDLVQSVAVSPDGRMVAAGSYETFSLFTLSDRKEVASLPEKAGIVRSLAWTPDSRLLAVGSYQTVALWDAGTRKKITNLPQHFGYVTSLAFSHDGRWLVTGCDDETVRVWETRNWSLRHKLVGHAKPVLSVAVSPTGTLIASSGGDETKPTRGGELKLWEISSGKEIPLAETHDKGVVAVAFSSDGKRLASAGFDEVVKLWEIPGGKLLRTMEGHSRPVNSVMFIPHGNLLVSSGGGRFTGGNDLRIWDTEVGTCRAILRGHAARVLYAAPTPDGKRIISGSGDTTLRSWNLAALLGPAAAKDASALAAAEEKKKPETETAKPQTEKPVPAPAIPAAPPAKVLRAGMIGLDTSHCLAFTQILNGKNPAENVAGCRIVAAYPKGSPDIESSTKRVPEYTQKMKSLDVEIVGSISELLTKVDVVFLETNDGRPHLEQVLPVLKAGKPVFIDKPIAGSLVDAIAIFEAAKKYNVPTFSSSSLRFAATLQKIRSGGSGAVYGCDVFSPCHLEATHPDFFWYGVHGVEMLYTVMGTGCERVTRVTTPETDVAVGIWKGGKVGSVRGIRHKSAGYGGSVFTEKGIVTLGKDTDYGVLIVEIVKFFRTGKPPVAEAETLELFTFMEAADESKRLGGVPVELAPLLEKARKQAQDKLPK